jgi:hypothetical protein
MQPPLWIPEGGAPAFGTGVDPKIILQVSNDGGRSWGNERAISLGKIGHFKKVLRWQRCGISNNRAYRVIWSDPVRTALIACDQEFTNDG